MINFSIGRYPLFFKKKTIDTLTYFTCKEISKKFSKGTNSFDVSFVSKNCIKRINRKYRGINKSTDVLSFAFCDSKTVKTELLGEIFISIAIARKNAKTIGNPIKKEICFLIIHGVLHLFGYDHQKLTDEKNMFSIQKEIMSKLNILK